jgi:hypothetical protein
MTIATLPNTTTKTEKVATILKDDKDHDVWHWSFNAQAVAQYVPEGLDETYIPNTANGIALFYKKQKYLYAFLKTTFKLIKAIVREHEHDFDAQQVYKKIKSYQLKPKLGNGSWVPPWPS